MFANDIIDSLGNVFVRAGKSKVINLAEEENFDSTKRSGVNCTIMCGALEVELGREEDRIDMTFPELSRFRMSLEGMQDWEDFGAVYFSASFPKVPVGASIVNRHVGRNHRR